MKILTWFKEFLHVITYYRAERVALNKRIDELEGLIRERTTVHADIHRNEGDHIILVGVYKNKEYVKAFNLPEEDFRSMVEQMRDMQRLGVFGRIDAHPEFKFCMEQEF